MAIRKLSRNNLWLKSVLPGRVVASLPSGRLRVLQKSFQTNVVAKFVVGERNTIAGLPWGVEGMRVGGRRRLRVGPHLAYQEIVRRTFR